MVSQDEEFRVVLSYAQMAAILEHQSLSAAEIASNRIFGGLRVVGGIIELAGAGVLCALPEPTMISKMGCVAMGVHASDQLAAGTAQLLSGETTASYAYRSGQAIAAGLGASPATGQVIGLAGEFAVPLSTASLYAAFRVSSVQAGRMRLNVSERPLHVPKNSVVAMLMACMSASRWSLCKNARKKCPMPRVFQRSIMLRLRNGL